MKIDHLKMNLSLLEKITALWSNEIGSLKLINEGINFVYRFEINGKGKILKLTCQSNRNYKELTSAVDYQRYLFENKVPIDQPIKSLQHHYIEEINYKSEIFFARVSEEIRGQILQFENDDKNIYKNWGIALAKLHKTAKIYQPNKQFKFINWKEIWNEVYGYVQLEEPKIKNEYSLITDWFNHLDCDENNFGLNHGDHRIGNVIYNDKNVYLIDFDEPVYHWFIADISRPFLELCEFPVFTWRKKLLWYLEGYRSILPIEIKQFNQIPWFIRMKNLELYLWTKNNWHHPIAPGGERTDQWLNNRKKMILNPFFSDWFIF